MYEKTAKEPGNLRKSWITTFRFISLTCRFESTETVTWKHRNSD